MKQELISKREQKFGDFENSQSIHTAKKGVKACSEKNTKSVAEEPFYKNIMGVTHGINQPFQRKPGKEK